MATGLRVGVVICPGPLKPALERAIRATTWNTPSLLTALMSHWIQDGTVARTTILKRDDARQRQALARECLHPLTCIGHPNSWFVWLPLADECRADRIVKALMDKHILISTAEPFSTSTNVPQALRLALGSVSMENLREALVVVREAVEYELSR